MMVGCKHKADASLRNRLGNLFRFEIDIDAQRFKNVSTSRGRRNAAAAMFGHPCARCCRDKHGCGEMLNVSEPSPPVPTMSIKWSVLASGTLVENSRITCA